jgi:hypothetical protein
LKKKKTGPKPKLPAAPLKSAAPAVIVLRTCLAHSQIAAVDGVTLQRIDSSLAFVAISHGHECKSPRLATHAISYDMNVSYGAVG